MPPAQLASKLTPRGWLILGGAAVGAILFIYLFVHMVSAPSYTTVVSGVEPAQTGKMTSALSTAGVSYELQSGGTAVAVQSNQVAKARVALAGANLLGNTQPGFSLFEKSKLGASNFEQQVTYQRALQGQLAETIDSVQGVSGAQVSLVLPSPENEIFGENQNNSSAAVALSGTDTLPPSSVRGIAQLVASSVPGLSIDKVTITDASGQLLWPLGSGTGGGEDSLQEAEQGYDQSMEASLDAMLAQTLGAGKAQVLVYANMNVDQTSRESLEYAKTGTPLQQSKSTETLSGTGTSVGGVTGTAAAAAGSTGGGKSNFKHETTTSTLGVSKTVTHSTIAPGTIESQHVSVLLDKSVPASAIPAIREAITNAAGIQTKRGDTISIGQVAFTKATGAAATSSPLSMAKYVLLGLGALIFLFFTTRSLRKRERETIDEPRWLRELEAPMRLSELERETRPMPAVVGAGAGDGDGAVGVPVGAGMGVAGGNGAPGVPTARSQVEQLVDTQPDRVAQQLRNWMQEG